jgi:two-component system cell cycle response regulator DivK
MSGQPVAPLSGSLLARKGSANASGFATAPDAVPPVPAPASLGPAGRREPETGNSPIPVPQDTRVRHKILIVEDDFLNMKLMTELFEGHGYGTLQADNGHAAITMARAKLPDLIVMDIQLPELSGLDAIRQLKSDGDLMDIPVIAVSAMARSAADGMIRGAGFDEFLAKPFTVRAMLLTVSRFLH